MFPMITKRRKMYNQSIKSFPVLLKLLIFPALNVDLVKLNKRMMSLNKPANSAIKSKTVYSGTATPEYFSKE